ncbi:MAG: helix-turn-helix domain-containing protein [Ruminococcaceae bacterium]|nr:helix-turn-helix domain-containing protein [Oscillospiraceae bacterium]
MTDDLLNVYSMVSVPGHRAFYPHHHSELEIAYFRSGHGTYSVTGREYPIEAGDIFMFSNNEIHKITYVDPAVPMEALNIHIHPRLILTEATALNLPQLFFDRRPGYSNRLNESNCTGDSSICDDIRRAMVDIEKEYHSGLPGSELLARQGLTRVLIYIMRGFDLIDTDTKRYSQSGVSAITSALEYIDSNYKNDISLTELCTRTGMSRSNFERLFTRLAGVSFGEYIKLRRIDCASALLRDSNVTVLEAALASGFHNTANFNKQFKSVTGVTPSEYRLARREGMASN